MIRIILGIICLCVALVIVACGGVNKLAANIIYDARTQIATAERVGAKQTTLNEFRDAENLLAEAEAVLDKGDDDEAYRIGMKAYLMARYAEVLAAKKRAEWNANIAESELKEARQAEEKALIDRGQAEEELSALEGD
jgi:hypothetical protein